MISLTWNTLLRAELHNWSRAREIVDKTLAIDSRIEDAIKLRDYLKQMK